MAAIRGFLQSPCGLRRSDGGLLSAAFTMHPLKHAIPLSSTKGEAGTEAWPLEFIAT